MRLVTILLYARVQMRSNKRVLTVLRILGPGLIAGSAADDPSGIGTYAIAGASLGYATLWTAVFTIPMMIAVQFTCAKISMITGRGLADASRRHYSPWIVYPALIALFGANTATLHASGQTDVNSAADAARALQPLAGSAASLLFAVGLIGAGMLAVPVLTGSAAYAIAGARRWRSGLDQAFGRARGFYSVMIASTVVGAGVNFTGINPFRALFVSALINGLLAPPLLALLLVLANRQSVMRRPTNGRLLNVVGWATTIVMAVAALGVIVTSRA